MTLNLICDIIHNSMKIAVTGKGGVGKTFLVVVLAKFFAEKEKKVFVIDADPDANLALTLGFPNPSEIIPLIKMKELIEERTGAKIGALAPYFKLNPKVDDIPDKYFLRQQGINLAVMGSVRGGGLGCTCPENAFLKALLRHLVVERKEVVILDMEAGIEHLGRGTTQNMDRLIVVVEPGRNSIETAHRIKDLAREIGISRIEIVGNKIRENGDKKFILDALAGFDFLGFIPYNKKINEAELKNIPFFEYCPEILKEGREIVKRLGDPKRIALR